MYFETRKLALMCVFAALYAVFSLVSLFPIIGALGRFITLATVLAPIVGMLLGPYVGVAAASVGGFVGWAVTQSGAFGFVSFIPGSLSALTAGFLINGERRVSAVFYLILFLAMAFFPLIGPVWLFPLFMWFQLIGLVVLVSPVSAVASKSLRADRIDRLTLGVGVIALVSALAGQVAGTLMFEVFFYPFNPQIESWRTAQWQFLTFVYPVERIIIAVLATLVGVPLIRAIRSYGFEVGGTQSAITRNSNRANTAEK